MSYSYRIALQDAAEYVAMSTMKYMNDKSVDKIRKKPTKKKHAKVVGENCAREKEWKIKGT